MLSFVLHTFNIFSKQVLQNVFSYTDLSFNFYFINNKYIIFLMVTFEPSQILFACLGGLTLGLATSLNYIIRGKVTGMSGIAYGIVSLNKSQLPEKLSIVGGMFFISSVFYLIFGNGYYGGFSPFGAEDQIAQWTTFPGFALSGFLVGFGTKLGNGCTSGHGLCGLPRFSLRSMVAVCTFLLVGIGMSTLASYVGLGPFVSQNPNSSLSPLISYNHVASSIAFLLIGLLMLGFGVWMARKNNPQIKTSTQVSDLLIVFLVGLIFAVGLMVSGMSRRINILQFLQLNDKWNPALMFVLGCGLLVNTITFTIMRKKGVSLNGSKVFDPKNNLVDWQLIGGAALFGLGWGIGGLCPGPFFVLFSVFTVPIQVLWGAGLVLGMLTAAKVSQKFASSPKQKPKEIQVKQELSPTNQDRLMTKN